MTHSVLDIHRSKVSSKDTCVRVKFVRRCKKRDQNGISNVILVYLVLSLVVNFEHILHLVLVFLLLTLSS